MDADQLVTVIVDCTHSGAPSLEFVAQIRAEALAMLESGADDAVAKAQNILDQAAEAHAAAQAAAITTRPLTDDEIAEREANAEVALDSRRLDRAAAVEAAIAATDKWAARAVEDAVPMSDARIKYRRELRALFAAIAAAPDVETLETIEIPAPPDDTLEG